MSSPRLDPIPPIELSARKVVRVALLFGLVVWLAPLLASFYVVCGLLDLRRHERITWNLAARYFLGSSGQAVWLLAPVNLLIDLVSQKNRGVYTLADLPPESQKEVREVIAAFEDRKNELVAYLDEQMASKKRGMIFFKWYGRNVTTGLPIPAFHADYRTLKTIGVSVYNAHQSTPFHFGPLRMTLRVLYNLDPVHDERVFVRVDNRVRYWHDDPLLIFDDTLIHTSRNEADRPRYCVFADILRPSPLPELLASLIRLTGTASSAFQRLMYNDWEFLR